MRDPVQKIAGPVERIDDEARLALGPGNFTALLHQEAPVGARGEQLVIDRAFGVLIGFRDEVCRALAADLQMLDLAEVAAQALAGLARSLFHDADDAGNDGHSSCSQSALPT